MGRIFDCFTFFNELDILEIRFNELYDVVDFFVITESPLTFKGDPKPLVFQSSCDRFSKFMDKVIHIVVDDMPHPATAWERESFQRNALRRGLSEVQPSDLVVISDADEILRGTTLGAARSQRGVTIFDMPMFQFFLNLQAKPSGWRKVFGFSGEILGALPDFNEPRIDPLKYFSSRGDKVIELNDAGWHFTFLGGADKVREKLKAYSHAGDVVDSMLEANGVENQILTGRQVGNINPLRFVRIDTSFPRFVLEHGSDLIVKGLIKDVFERLAELETLRAEDLNHVALDMEKRLTELRKAHDFAQQRRAETGKRLEWMTSQVDCLKQKIHEVAALAGESQEVESVDERLKRILAICKEVQN